MEPQNNSVNSSVNPLPIISGILLGANEGVPITESIMSQGNRVIQQGERIVRGSWECFKKGLYHSDYNGPSRAMEELRGYRIKSYGREMALYGAEAKTVLNRLFVAGTIVIVFDVANDFRNKNYENGIGKIGGFGFGILGGAIGASTATIILGGATTTLGAGLSSTGVLSPLGASLIVTGSALVVGGILSFQGENATKQLYVLIVGPVTEP